MLDTLHKLPAAEQQDTLLRITDWLLPHPGVGAERQPLNDRDLTVLHEATTSLGLATLDLDGRAPTSLIDLVDQELDRVSLPPDRALAAKRRLGDRGELAAEEYRVAIVEPDDDAALRWLDLGVTAEEVKAAVRHPDRVDHLAAPFTTDATQRLSIFEQRDAGSAGTTEAFRRLVIAARQGDELTVMGAFRVYESDVDLTASERPTDSLRLLVNAYGVPVAFYAGPPKLFYLSERVHANPAGADATAVRIYGPTDQRAVLQQLMVRPRDGGLDIAVAFAISLDKYAVALGRHGVRIVF